MTRKHHNQIEKVATTFLSNKVVAKLEVILSSYTPLGVNIGRNFFFSEIKKTQKLHHFIHVCFEASVATKKMEVQQWWRLRFSFRNATMVVCFLNVITAIFLLHVFLTSAYTRSKLPTQNSKSAQLSYIKESEEIRLAMLPLELIKRVREIEQEVYTEPQTAQKKDTKQTAAVDLSKRLKDFRSLNDAASMKALEEWRKRKMERARQRQMEKNGTTSSQA